jgi:hypothetical protein
MSAPVENSEYVTLVIGEFPSYAAGVLRAEAEARGVSLSEVCAGILRAHAGSKKQES